MWSQAPPPGSTWPLREATGPPLDRRRPRSRRPAAQPASHRGARRAARRVPRARTRGRGAESPAVGGRGSLRPAPAPRGRAGRRRCASRVRAAPARACPPRARRSARTGRPSVSGRSSMVSQDPRSGLREVATMSRLPGPARISSASRLARRVVEPVQVLRHEDRRLAAGAGDDVVERSLRDLLFELAALGRGRLVSRTRIDPEDRSQERDGLRTVESQIRHLAGEALAGARRGRRRRGCRSGLPPGGRTGWKPASTWKGEPCSSRKPAFAARTSSSSAATRRDLPTPASPRTNMPAARSAAPAATRAQACRSRASSSSRSTSGVDHERGPGHGRSPTTRNGIERLGHALHQLRFAGLELEVVLDELPHLVRDDDGARVGKRLQPRADVGGKTVDVVLVEVEVDGAVMDPHAKLERFARGRARAAAARAPLERARARRGPPARHRSRARPGSRRSTARRHP